MAEETLEQKREKAFKKKSSEWLPEATKAKYKVVGIEEGSSSRKVFAKYGEVNFTALSPARAAQLVKKGFPHLVAKTVAEKKEKS